MAESIKVVSCGLDVVQIDGEENLVLRGVIDPGSLQNLQVDTYQREIQPLATIAELSRAYAKGNVPGIDLGMRGSRTIERSDAIYLQDPVYIIDGLQRVTAALHRLQLGDEPLPRVGAEIYFDTTEPWERERFRILNMDRKKLSPNILLRNSAPEYEAIRQLIKLTEDKSFVLHNRVSWNQRVRREELLTAVTFAKVIGALHAHAGPGRSTNVMELARGLEKIMQNVGPRVFADNVRTLFDLIDELWGIRRVAFKEGAVYMRSGFLRTIASVFSQHTDFWREDRLFIEAPLKRKLALFPVTDPQVAQLSSSNGQAANMLYYLIVKHINSGKRHKRLTPRDSTEYMDLDVDDQD